MQVYLHKAQQKIFVETIMSLAVETWKRHILTNLTTIIKGEDKRKI